MQADYFAVSIPEPPAGLSPAGQEVGPAGQLFRVWRAGAHDYLSIRAGNVEVWFVLVAMHGREQARAPLASCCCEVKPVWN